MNKNVNNKQSTWTIIGMGNSVGDVIEMIELSNGKITCALFNQEISEKLIKKLPQNTRILDLATFQPETEHYCFGFLDPRKDELLQQLALYNLSFPNLIHPAATVSVSVQMGQGNMIGAGAVLGAETILGNFNYLNRIGSVGHDTVIGNYNHIGPGAVIAGRCIIENACFFGAHSTVIDGLSITSKVLVGAGSTVIKSIGESGTYVGSPVRRLEK